MKKLLLLLFLGIGILVFVASGYAQTYVEQHGQLRVSGNRIVDKNGQAITLHGMSMYAWAQQGLQYYNATAIGRLVNEWKCTVIRIPILPANVSSQTSLVRTVVDACIANGVYAIIDWHAMGGADASACSSFMASMASSYGNTPNVMYEPWNEPATETWATIKAYHQQVISAIRAIDPDNIIICGNEQWDQHPNVAAASPITSSTNIAYSMHFYATTHKQWLRDNTTTALNLGVAIFSTEYGTCESTGNGAMDTAETQTWWNFLDANGVGCTNWSVSALDETSAAFYTGTSATAWTDSNLKPSGALVQAYIISKYNGSTTTTTSTGGSTTTTSTGTCTATAIVPYIQVSGGTWQNVSSVSVSSGATVVIGPQPLSGGTWSWSGCGTSGTAREQTIYPTSSCTITATFTNDCGAKSTQAFTITVSVTSTKGDVNSNGTIDIVDALLIAQSYVGLNPANFNSANADVNCSGAVDIVDALLVAQRYVGLVTSFPC